MKNLLKVTLLCTSDVHGYYMPWDYSKDEYTKKGGLTRVSTIAKKIREENPHTILIDNGDLIQGNSAESFLKSEKYPGIEVINKMKYEIYNMGNHEFNFGMDTLIDVVGQFNGVSMMGNLYRKRNTMRFMNGIYYKHFNGVRIGFIALNTPLVRKFESKRGNLKNYDVIDAEFELKKLLNEVEDCDALIGLFHMGDVNENSIPNTGVIDLLNNVEGSSKIDAIFGGHMHQIVKEKINNTIFLEPGVHADAISKIDLYFDLDKKKKLEKIEYDIIDIDESIESDEELEEVIDPYHKFLREKANEVFGYSTENLNEKDEIKGIPQVRVAQTKIADFFLEVMKHFSKADVLVTHFDNPYPCMPKGEIKRKHINNSYSYSGGEVTTYNIKGSDLRKYIEWTASAYNKFNKGDINISLDKKRDMFKYSTIDIFGNIKYDIDLTEEKNNRIKNLRYMNDVLIEDEDDITIGLNKYRMDFMTSKEGPLYGKKFEPVWSSISALEPNGSIRSMARLYIKSLPNRTYKPSNDKRWNILIDKTYEEKREKAIDLINKDILLLYQDDEGKIDLTRSLNLFDSLEDYQIKHLSKFIEVDKSDRLIDILDRI